MVSQHRSILYPAKKEQAELLFHRIGITFNVYGEDEGTERLIPFDSVPRIIPGGEWKRSIAVFVSGSKR